jgi:glycerol-3-phosphate dehydrogenase (NAD(P)+)
MAGADLIVSAVPCQYMRPVWSRLGKHVPTGVPIVSVAKGIEIGTLLRPSEILGEVLGSGVPLAALSGPTIADELARKLPATACAAARDEALAQRVQATFNCSWFRVYTNTDLIGVELAGAMKNVIAIAAGIVDAMGLGHNALSALITRGLAEISRLAGALGGRRDTLSGLSGLGDLVLTCTGSLSRNRQVGMALGEGRSLAEILAGTRSVAEGVRTTHAALVLGREVGVELPITQKMDEIMTGGKDPRRATEELMVRPQRPEAEAGTGPARH